MKAAVLGATGYTGLVLLRYLTTHPEIDQVIPVTSSSVGIPCLEKDPGLPAELLAKTPGQKGLFLSREEALKLKPDVVFAALPHLKSGDLCAPFLENAVVIDLSADFRIEDPELFEKAYGHAQPRPDLQAKAVYGLAEWHREAVRNASLIANPGCYPTATLLPLLPLAKEGLMEGKIITNALSGISGAGKKAKEMLLFCERSENTCAYAPGKTHRHTVEIQKELDKAGEGLDLFFTPHLVPLKRGMEVTTCVSLKQGYSEADIYDLYRSYYGESPFVRLRRGRLPETREVRSSNLCDIAWHSEGDTLFLFSVIDNLVKGASGQAVQNMNIRFGIPETAGLRTFGDV